MSVAKPPKSSVLRHLDWESSLIYGLGLLCVVGATWFTYQFIEPAPPRQLTIATGSTDGAYQKFAQQLREHLQANEVSLEIVETEGSVDNLQRLDEGSVDVAFMQSGLANAEDYPHLESLGAMYYEPVWIFVRSDTSFDSMLDLQGLRVAIGSPGSGTRSVALRLIAENGFDESALQLTSHSGMQAVDALRSGEIDVVVSVASINASTIDTLFSDAAFSVVSLERAPAYARRDPSLMHLTLPEGVVDLSRNFPAQSIQLLAVNATLIGSEQLHPALRELLIQASDKVFSKPTLLSAPGVFPSTIGSDFPLSAEAIRYYQFGPPFLQRYLPFWVANLVDRLKLLALPLVALLLPLTRMLPPAYRWAVRKKIYRWYDEVQELDKSAMVNDSVEHQTSCLMELQRIENEVRNVKVPLSYAHELYGLRHHVELLSRQIQSRLNNGPLERTD